MKPFEECALCIVKWIYERVSYSAKEEQRYALIRTIMDVLSREFIPGYSTGLLEEAYKKSDLVIAKGVFNFESLAGEDLEKPVVYMLKIKCDLLSQENNVDIGNLIIKLENP